MGFFMYIYIIFYKLKLEIMKELNLNRVIKLFLIVLLFTGCADVSNIEPCISPLDLYGFWSGLWHGMISVFALVASLFSDDIAIYAVNNNGDWYDFGFMLGIGALSSISTGAVKR